MYLVLDAINNKIDVTAVDTTERPGVFLVAIDTKPTHKLVARARNLLNAIMVFEETGASWKTVSENPEIADLYSDFCTVLREHNREAETEEFDETACLKYDPFCDDYGDQSDLTLKDKIVTTRKDYICSMCSDVIQKNTRTRVRVDRIDGVLMNFRWCSNCCAAIALSWDDDGIALESRSHCNQ